MKHKIQVRCIHCRQLHEVEVDSAAFVRWRRGELIQIAMPELSADARELLISQTCPKCWDSIFGKPETKESRNARLLDQALEKELNEE